MKTVYRFIDSTGRDLDARMLRGNTEHLIADIVSVEVRYNTDPEDPSDNELIMTLKLQED